MPPAPSTRSPLATLATFAQDLRQALRQLRQAPVFTLAVVLTLALGIGANTAIFTLIQGILLRSLPVANPAQLYRIGDTNDCCVNGGFVGDHGDFDIFSYPLYRALRAAAPEFEHLAAVQAGNSAWAVRRGGALARPMSGELVSGNYFTTLGLRPFAGRFFTAADDRPGAAPVAVISYTAWQSEFAGDRSILGAEVNIQAHPFTIIGIAPRGFFGDRVSDRPPLVWLPLIAEPTLRGENPASALLVQPDEHWLYPIGRVRPGTHIAALQAQLSATLRNWLSSRSTYTANGGAAIIPKQHVVLVPAGGGIQSLQQQTGDGLRLLMILAAVVLLIACANIANLLLARGTARQTEIAVRMALGESRPRLVRRLLTESALLGCLGGLAGLAVAYAGSRTLLALAFPTAQHSAIAATPNAVVLLFALAVSLATGILFGLAPAWLAAHAHPADALRGAGRSTRDRASFSQYALVVFQAALSLVLLAGALLMSRSLANLQNQNFGVATANRYVLHLDPSGAGYTRARLPALERQLQDRLAGLPGMASVGLAMYSPLEGDNWGECVIPQGGPAPGPNSHCGSTWERVSPGFLDAIGVPIVRGRGFTDQDTATSPQVALVNQTFVQHFFPHQDPIGQHFGIDYPQYSAAFEIVGVFRDFKMNDPRGPVRPVFLRPFGQRYGAYTQTSMNQGEDESQFVNAIVLHFRHAPGGEADALVRRTLAGIDPNLTVADFRSFGEQVAGNFIEDRLVADLCALFGLLALVLASVGLYGVTAYLVARRRSEIGIRMALGASRGSVVGLVLRRVGAQVGVGLALGLPAAYFAARLMQSQLYGVPSSDPRAYLGASAALALCALIAGLIPARRAAATDPAQTLRAE
ncbi:MAG TPA: ABC transporter permease [Terriglobales bacterium]|nr:ABC transporter permease [Terriglobales bacterium]